MKKTLFAFAALLLTLSVAAAKKPAAKAELQFDAAKGVARQLTTPQGRQLNYTAYERLFFVTNVEDSAYQYLNVFVPEGATQQSPIFLRTYVGGYMASAAGQPQADDASGRALEEGFVVVIPGSRGRNSVVPATKAYAKAHKGMKAGQDVYTGRAPHALLDLKAAIRYLRHFDAQMAGDAEHIVTDGTSAGGAMSALMGATGNHPAYEQMLDLMGAAHERDDVFASVCFCPITDLDHADMAYEWLYNQTASRQQGNAQVLEVSNELKALYPRYLNSLGLIAPNGEMLTADTYLDFIKREIIRGAQLAKNAGATIPDTVGFSFSTSSMAGMPPLNGQPGMREAGGRRPGGPIPPFARRGGGQQGEYITDLDMQKYLDYVVSTQPLKTAPAFDTKGVCQQEASGENEEFGDETGSSVNFTDYACQKTGQTLTNGIAVSTALMNPMNFIDDQKATVAPHWYIRHGARDRDTAFPVPLNLALKLQNSGRNVDYLLAWNRPHSGDYALDELFAWLKTILK